MTDIAEKYTYKDFASDQEVRWCPGCDDYVILRSVQKALPEIGVQKEDIVFISGIGCSSRFPYYMDNYGMHGIHGRAPAIATGVKMANPSLSVWLITGDGDALAIGGNHFIHLLRRNLNMNVILFNNEIYGLTKGQFSPTSTLGLKTKSSPHGNTQPPFHPGQLAIGAGARFFARIAGNEAKEMTKLFIECEKFQGTSLVEVLQNCVIFNDGCFDDYTAKDVRADAQILLKHGEPMIFGANKEKGIRLNGLKLEVVSLLDEGITTEDLLVHDATIEDPTLHLMLARLDYPLATGVIRAVEDVTFDDRTAELQKKIGSAPDADDLDTLFNAGETYNVN